jgi:hypothetical protein
MQFEKGDKVIVIAKGAPQGGFIVKRHMFRWVAITVPTHELKEISYDQDDVRLLARKGCSYHCLDCGTPHEDATLKEKIGPNGELFMYCRICGDFKHQQRLQG